MGVKILNEDGTLLHEFREGLGVILLDRLITAAKFRNDPDWDLLVNEHVANLGTALRKTLPPRGSSQTTESVDDDLCRQASLRLTECLRNHILTGAVSWPRWTPEEKRSFVRDVVFAPWTPSKQFVEDYVEERDVELTRWRKALDGD